MARRRVQAGDADPAGVLRLDAVARYLQDIAGDDSRDAMVGPGSAWVVRRTLIEVVSPIAFGDDLEVVTWASGSGSRWAERRTTVTSAGGGRLEAAALWVHLDQRQRPAPLPDGFEEHYRPATGGRVVSGRLQHRGGPAEEGDRAPWPLRLADLDVLGHVNNPVPWAAVEEVLDRLAGPRRRRRGRYELEYRRAIEPGDVLELVGHRQPDGSFAIWLAEPGADRAEAVAVSARVRLADA